MCLNTLEDKEPQHQPTENPSLNIQEGHVDECLQFKRQKHWCLLVIPFKLMKMNCMFSFYFKYIFKQLVKAEEPSRQDNALGLYVSANHRYA